MRSVQNAISQLPGWGASSGKSPNLILPLTGMASGGQAAAVDMTHRRSGYGNGYNQYYWNSATGVGPPAGGAQHIGGASFACGNANVLISPVAAQNDYARGQAVTWGYWVKLHSYNGAGGHKPIARGSNNATFGARDIAFTIRSDGGANTRYFSSSNSRTVASDAGVVPLGVWTHLVNVAQAGTSYVYQNGVVVGSGDTEGNVNQTDRFTCIGGLSANTAHSTWLYSDMDMAWVVMYNYALDAQAVTKLYAATNPFT